MVMQVKGTKKKKKVTWMTQGYYMGPKSMNKKENLERGNYI